MIRELPEGASMSVVYTIGYQGTTIDNFVAKLAAVGIHTLVDVRELPLSRKKGFSKRSLQERLAAAGLSYVHMADLGTPSKGREAARSGRVKKFRQIYLSHFRGRAAQQAFKSLIDLGRTRSVCMMCFEREPVDCHRSIIAERIKKRGFSVLDLFVEESTRYDKRSQVFTSCCACEGAPAAE
jgi:uncharacterized protein (DUF488 family)